MGVICGCEELRNTDHKKCWKSSRLTFRRSEKNASRCELTHNAVKFNFRQIGKAREWCSLEAANESAEKGIAHFENDELSDDVKCVGGEKRESCAERGKL